jgi:hypothetical protein
MGWHGAQKTKGKATCSLATAREEVLRGELLEENVRRQEITNEIENILEQEEIYKMQRS